MSIFMITSINLAEEPNVKTLEIGQKAPNFNLKGIDDKNYGKTNSIITSF